MQMLWLKAADTLHNAGEYAVMSQAGEYSVIGEFLTQHQSEQRFFFSLDFRTGHYFRCPCFVFPMSSGTVLIAENAGTVNTNSNGYVRFERGPESMFRRVMIQDASGNLLETFENYNDLYNNRLNTEGPGIFHGEGLVYPRSNGPGVEVTIG